MQANPAILPSVTLLRTVGMAKLYLKPLPRARARAMEKLSVPFSLCTDWRGPSKTSWSRNLDLRWSPEVRCWPGWLSIVPIFSCPSPRVSHTMATHPTCDKPWRVEMPSFGECVDCRRRTRHKLESRWSRGVFVGVCVKTTERIVMDETGTNVVQSVRRVHRLLQSVRGSPWEPNSGEVSADFREPVLIVPHLPEVEPAPTQTYHSDNRGTRNVYIRLMDLEKFGHMAGCPTCEVHRAGSLMSG